MTGWQHPNPTAAGPGEIVGIYPIELSPEESELVNNHLFRAQANYPISHYIKAKYFFDVLHSQTISAKRLDLYEDTSEGLYPEANRHFDSPFVRGVPAVRDRN